MPTTRPKHSIGQRVFWQGQEGGCDGIVTRITEPESGNFVLWVDLSDENCQRLGDFPIGDNAVSDVWNHTLDEYEKCIASGNANGASVLRALILEKLKPSESDNCGFCGENLTECECPQPM